LSDRNAKWNNALSARHMSFDPTAWKTDEKSVLPPQIVSALASNADSAVEVEREEWKRIRANRLVLAMKKLDERSRNILKRRWIRRTRRRLA